jgi:hypothetical protein
LGVAAVRNEPKNLQDKTFLSRVSLPLPSSRKKSLILAFGDCKEGHFWKELRRPGSLTEAGGLRFTFRKILPLPKRVNSRQWVALRGKPSRAIMR